MSLRDLLLKVAKVTYYPFKYRQGNGYDAEAYWRDRFARHGMSFRGVGHEGTEEVRNRLEYERSPREFQDALHKSGIDFAGKRVLEIGVGNGYYLDFCFPGSAYYCAVDITDLLFPELAKRYPEVHFVKADVCKLGLREKFDIILMIDVLEHIVTENDLRSALSNLKSCLADGGTIIIGPIHEKTKKHLFYVHFWSVDKVAAQFRGYAIEMYRPFRKGTLIVVRSPHERR